MIFLTILKIIGIVLACIVALILLVILLFMFLPIRYKIVANGHNANTDVVANVKWFFGIIHVNVTFIENNFNYYLKIFGIKINLEKSDDKKDDKVDEKNIKVDIRREKPSSIQKRDGDSQIKIKIRPRKKKITIKERFIKLLDKIKEFFIKLKNVKEFLSLDATKNTIKLIKKLVINVIKHIFPKKIIGNIKYGLIDPATTAFSYGLFAGYLEKSQKGKLLITPDFEENGVYLDLKIYGRLFVGYMVLSYLRLILNKDYKQMIKAKRRLF